MLMGNMTLEHGSMNSSGQTEFFYFLLDLDGTLIDQFGFLYECYRGALALVGERVPEFEEFRGSVGGSMPVTMKQWVTDPERYEKALRHCRESFFKASVEGVEALHGAEAFLQWLKSRGHRAAVFTNKPGKPSREIIRQLGWDGYLDFVLGADDTPWRKPDKGFIDEAMRRAGSPAVRTAMVGDSVFDVESAGVGGLQPYMVTTGTHRFESLKGVLEANRPVESLLPSGGIFKDLDTLRMYLESAGNV